MNYRDRRRYDMLARVRNFGMAHGQRFPDTSTAHAAFAIVGAEVEQLGGLDVAERLASHSARAARKASARKSLIDCLTRAKNTARVLARTIPELAAHVELPEAMDDRLLLSIAQQFADTTASHVGQFAAHGIALDELGEQVETFETALNERGIRRDAQAQARALIDSSMARAFQAVETLDVTVANHLATDAVTLAAWKRDRRLTRVRRPRNGAVSASTVSSEPEPESPPIDVAEPTPVASVPETT